MTEVAIAAAVVILVSAVCSLFEAVLYSVPREPRGDPSRRR